MIKNLIIKICAAVVCMLTIVISAKIIGVQELLSHVIYWQLLSWLSFVLCGIVLYGHFSGFVGAYKMITGKKTEKKVMDETVKILAGIRNMTLLWLFVTGLLRYIVIETNAINQNGFAHSYIGEMFVPLLFTAFFVFALIEPVRLKAEKYI